MHSFLLRNAVFLRCGSSIELERIRKMTSREGPRRRRDRGERPEKDLDAILDSPACRRLFTWGRSKDAVLSSDEKAVRQREEERLRWNFDFETETPLPGRYQWYRSDRENGHARSGGGTGSGKGGSRGGEVVVVEQRRTRSQAGAPYTRKPRAQAGEKCPSAGSSAPLSQKELRRSERCSQQPKTTRCRLT